MSYRWEATPHRPSTLPPGTPVPGTGGGGPMILQHLTIPWSHDPHALLVLPPVCKPARDSRRQEAKNAISSSSSLSVTISTTVVQRGNRLVRRHRTCGPSHRFPPLTRQCNYPAEPTSFYRGAGEHASGAVSRRPEDRTPAESSGLFFSPLLLFFPFLFAGRIEWESPANIAKVSLLNRP
ncbi:uncharacterized protein LY79DRAFT_176408 [Colletotrichum navitas]|uniref:Uncharacterized protein n=1 Tax=Colletotrichum navitas TaxID=681940 RepID=A0AAD8Q2H0_9PEZI|nr:uncharacterized protein LY79DRAFT_176408 [Colletotrichum navitas]KAK1593654.1 hypothetical protein LY79DRAFT_176408 [Colletotrichum navitas]